MRRATIGGLAICIGMFGCGGADRAEEANRADADRPSDVRPIPVTETGCLTARGSEFVLTNLERGAGEATTETFLLVGQDEKLRQLVGKQVRVTGEAEPPKVAVVQESTPAPPQGDRAQGDKPQGDKPQGDRPQGTTGAEPKVTTQAQTRMEVRKLEVATVEDAGASCAAETDAAGATPPRRQ